MWLRDLSDGSGVSVVLVFLSALSGCSLYDAAQELVCFDSNNSDTVTNAEREQCDDGIPCTQDWACRRTSWLDNTGTFFSCAHTDQTDICECDDPATYAPLGIVIDTTSLYATCRPNDPAADAQGCICVSINDVNLPHGPIEPAASQDSQYVSVFYPDNVVNRGQVTSDIDIGDTDVEVLWDKTADVWWITQAQPRDAPRLMTWAEGFAFCQNLRAAGYSDWRLPTILEATSILDPYKDHLPLLDDHLTGFAYQDPYTRPYIVATNVRGLEVNTGGIVGAEGNKTGIIFCVRFR